MSKNKKIKKSAKAAKPAKAKAAAAKKSKPVVKKAAKKAAPVKALKALKKPAKALSSPAKKEDKKSLKAALKPEAKAGKVKQVLPLAQPVAAAPEEESEDVALTNAEGKRYCKVADCDEVEAIDAYCRLHYIMYWKRNKTKGKILEGGKLDKYIDELTARYPDKYLEMLKKDLSSEKEFNGIISEMDAEEANDEESEEEDNRFIEEVRGTATAGTGSDDDGEF